MEESRINEIRPRGTRPYRKNPDVVRREHVK